MPDAVRVAISGLGSFASVVGNAIEKSRKVKIVTCFTRTPEKRAGFSARYGCGQDASFEAMVRRDDVDAVVLVTPNAVHREQAELAARHGKHVLVEKPIANTAEDGRAMIAACRTAGVVLMVAHVARRHAGNRMAKKLLDAGMLGKPMLVEANLSSEQGVGLVPEEFRWRGDDLGCPGGPLMTMGVHHADTFNYLFGPVKSVFSLFNKRHIAAPIPDITTTVLQFESGVLGYIGSTFASPRTNWMRIYGTEANLVRTFTGVDRTQATGRKRSVDEDTRLEIIRSTGTDPVELPIGDPMLEQLEEFADCIRLGRKPETDGESAMQALAVIRAAIESAATGRPVDVRA
ncbi:MAG TPA: Gfo/Idh/MocA family oxidoreductase [Burkholderiales bacterium]|nr:Gfo/Idh/MocA family oxidoreductase [Burkholderiales bacterium]